MLGEAVIEATRAGDLEAARVANDAIAKLLGSPDPRRDDAEVVDLDKKRRER
ncbi:MAG: hypothetical protein KF729_33720 [Sandaracinaceae bacterium]|nr:hypothetical protein [Sandaracinaceae bacterium]